MSDNSTRSIEPGERVYGEDGRLLGRVSGFHEDGFEVEHRQRNPRDGSGQEEVPGQEFGEGYLMWRCEECGEMGELHDGFPQSCPHCGASREAVTAVQED